MNLNQLILVIAVSNLRFMKFANHMVDSPQCSINQAYGNWSEVKVAYRFFQNENVSADEILASHVMKTVERSKQYKIHIQVTIRQRGYAS